MLVFVVGTFVHHEGRVLVLVRRNGRVATLGIVSHLGVDAGLDWEKED